MGIEPVPTFYTATTRLQLNQSVSVHDVGTCILVVLAAKSFGRHALVLLKHPVFGHTMLDKRKLCRVRVVHCYHSACLCGPV